MNQLEKTMAKKKVPKIVQYIRNKPLPEINFAYQKVISISQINMYQNCQKQWALRYKDKNKPFSSSIHSIFGSAIHEAIQHYLDVMYKISGVEADKIDIEEYFKKSLFDEYNKRYKENNGHFSSPSELREIYDDGCLILRDFKKKKGSHFSKRGWHLVGCEIPVRVAPIKTYNNVIFTGYLDIVMYHEPTNTIKIIDIKTSKSSWGKKKKDDPNVRAQLILYKTFFSELYNFPIENIEIEFFIVKRKLWEDCDFAQKRIQLFIPPSGKNSVNKAKKLVHEFIKDCFNTDGSIKEKEYKKNISTWSCQFCPFKEDYEKCPKNKKIKELLKQ